MNRRPVTRIRTSPAGTDPDGDPVATTTDTLVIAGCLVAPGPSTEPGARGRQGVVVDLTVYAPVGADVVHTDHIEVDGVAYRVEGRPGPFTGSRVGGVEIELVRAAG